MIELYELCRLCKVRSVEENMNFEYMIQNDRIEITSYRGQEQVVTIPAEIEGKPVTSIGKYAFEGNNDVLEILLPETVDTIKAHAFYNCRKLEKMSLSDCVTETEDGAFKNCRSLRFFNIAVLIEKMTCLKNLLSELNQELHVELEYRKERQGTTDELKKSKLVFPKYAYDYVDNVEARIINQVTYGSGVHYRECMKEKNIDFRKYDQVFSVAVVNDSLETLFTIARNRLEYPYELLQEAKEQYRHYIQEHLMELAGYCIQKDIDGLLFLGDQEFLTRDNIDAIMELAHKKEQIESVSVLLDYKRKHFPVVKKRFEL